MLSPPTLQSQPGRTPSSPARGPGRGLCTARSRPGPLRGAGSEGRASKPVSGGEREEALHSLQTEAHTVLPIGPGLLAAEQRPMFRPQKPLLALTSPPQLRSLHLKKTLRRSYVNVCGVHAYGDTEGTVLPLFSTRERECWQTRTISPTWQKGGIEAQEVSVTCSWSRGPVPAPGPGSRGEVPAF